MPPETVLQKEEYKDDFQWVREFDLSDNFPAASKASAPFAETCHQLMIFNGLHAGASLGITDGTYSLGRSYECDIVLKDPGVEPIHLQIHCQAGTFILRPEFGAVYLDGQLVIHETELPQAPVVLTITGVHFGLAVEGAIWYPLVFPKINENAGNLQDKKQDEQDEQETPSDGPAGIMAHFKLALNHLHHGSALSKFVPVVFIFLFFISAMFFFHVKVPDNATLITDIEKQFLERHLPKPDIHVDAEGFLDITAYAPTNDQKEKIAAFLQRLPMKIRPHIYADDQIEQALQDYIAKMAFSVEAAYQGNGNVFVKGFVENHQEADVLENLLTSNVMGLRNVDLQIRRMEQVRPELAAILKEADLTDKIKIRPQSAHLLAEGNLNADERIRWQAAKKTIIDRLGRPLKIVDRIGQNKFAGNSPGKIDIPIAGVTMKPYPFITLQDGKVYFKGASFQNGTILKDIGPERIVVEINGQEYYYNF